MENIKNRKHSYLSLCEEASYQWGEYASSVCKSVCHAREGTNVVVPQINMVEIAASKKGSSGCQGDHK